MAQTLPKTWNERYQLSKLHVHTSQKLLSLLSWFEIWEKSYMQAWFILLQKLSTLNTVKDFWSKDTSLIYSLILIFSIYKITLLQYLYSLFYSLYKWKIYWGHILSSCCFAKFSTSTTSCRISGCWCWWAMSGSILEGRSRDFFGLVNVPVSILPELSPVN